jgi:truncated hemoglobin YjbI
MGLQGHRILKQEAHKKARMNRAFSGVLLGSRQSVHRAVSVHHLGQLTFGVLGSHHLQALALDLGALAFATEL